MSLAIATSGCCGDGAVSDPLLISSPLDQNANYDSRIVAGGDTGGKLCLDRDLGWTALGLHWRFETNMAESS